MRKFLFLTLLLCLLMNLNAAKAQTKTLKASTAQITTAVISSGSNNVWKDVTGAATTLALTANTKKVLVEATIEVAVASGNSDILANFRLIDNSTPLKESQTISRYVATKTYEDKGIVTISFIFDYPNGVSGDKTFTLQHAKDLTPGANKTFSSKAVITAIEIASAAVVLPNGHGTITGTFLPGVIPSVSTASTTFSEVAKTNAIVLANQANIYIVSTFSTSTNAPSAVNGGWALRESLNSGAYTLIDDAQITRTVLDATSIGTATLVTMISRPAGTYNFQLAHKVNTGSNIITSGATISAIALTSTAGDVFAAISALDQTDDNATNAYEPIIAQTIIPPSNTSNQLFMRTSFNMTATPGDIQYATYQFSSVGGIFTPFEIQRYVPTGTTGSGGLIGIVSGLSKGNSYLISFKHKKSLLSSNTLTTFNLNAIGFYLTSSPKFTWVGTTSDWNTAGNWVSDGVPNGVPSYNDIVVIPDTTNDPIISNADNKGSFNITIASGASLTVSENMVLKSAQINNSGSLILKSSAAGTGYLLCSSAVANVKQERYLTSNQRGWRLLSNPLSTIDFATLASGSTTPITLGTNATGAYNSVSNTWTLSANGDASNMESQKAYEVFIRGRADGVNGINYDPIIPLNVTLAITGTASNSAPAIINTVVDQYYLIANPYTAPMSVYSILGASTGLSNTVSYYNPTKASVDVKVKAGGYDVIDLSSVLVPGDANDVVIPPMGAIFVSASAAGTIHVPTTAIYTGTVLGGNYAHKTANTKEVSPVALTIAITSNGVAYDKLQLRFKEVGSAGSNIDFGKLQNTILDFYSITEEGKEMAVSELELTAQTIPLGIWSSAKKGFTFNIAKNSIPAEFEAVLEDTLLGTQTLLTEGTDYNFAIDNNTSSQGNDRFSIVLKPSKSLSVGDETLDAAIVMWPNPASNQFHILNNQNDGDTTFEIYSIIGQLMHREKALSGSKTTIKTNGWASGVYIMKATHNGNKTTKKLIIE